MAENPRDVNSRTDFPDFQQREAVLGWLRDQLTGHVDPAPAVDSPTLQRWTEEYLRSKLPVSGRLVESAVGSVRAPVRVRRDTWGIAHLSAESERDLFFGLGYAMAQDRLWQMDYQRRFVRGELASVLGRRALSSDRTMRILSIGAAGDRAWETASPDVRETLDAFAAGVNAWIEQVGPRLPLEFEVLEYAPAPWRPADSIAIWKHRWWTLTGRLETIVVADVARRTLPADLADAFFSLERADETIVPVLDGDNVPDQFGGGGSPDEGSNNWIVGGAHTTTGAPVVCSDPHNPFSAPSQWFEAQLTCPSFDAAGAIYIGTPVLYLGRNRNVAWGLTNHAISVRDLYREEIDPGRPDHYRDGSSWRPFAVERQVIAVAGESDEPLEIRRTARGPVVTELLPFFREEPEPPTITLRWLATETPSGIDATLGLLRARSSSDVLNALRQWPCPPLNFVYADRAGSFGYHAVGLVPRRGRGGDRVRDANDPEDRWSGFMTFDELPRDANPPRGWVATANNVPWAGDAWYLASGAWSDGYRARRIRERLNASEKLRPDEIAAIHGDVQSGRARDLVPFLLRVVESGRSSVEQQAIDVLRSWDYQHTTSSVGASIWTAFWAEWCLALARARFPRSLVEHAATRVTGVARRLLLGDAIAWFPGGDSLAEIRRAFTAAIAALTVWAGSEEVQTWQWGKLHQAVHPHPLAVTPDLEALYNTGPYPTSGGGSIVRAAGHGFAVPFAVTSGSTYRFKADLSRPDRLQAVQTLGQSAHLGSPHYRDQTRLWLDDAYHPFWMSEEDVLANLESELVIKPG